MGLAAVSRFAGNGLLLDLLSIRLSVLTGALILLFFQAPLIFAAVPVEDMSIRDVRGDAGLPLTAPQPVLPDELAVQPGYPNESAADSTSTSQRPGPTYGNALDGQPEASLRPGQNAQLFYELQVLQGEVRQLRGMIEDQAFEIKRLRDLQRSQYLDIDRRLVGQGFGIADSSTTSSPSGITAERSAPNPLSPEAVRVQAGESAAASVPPARSEEPQPVLAAPASESESASASAPANAAPSEQEAYTAAFELMKDQQFEESIVAYQSVIEKFPDGTYAPESRYWLGELYLMSDRLEDARGAFDQLVEQFPAHQKVPLSLYKLGVVNHRLGGISKALEYLDDVVVRYPDTPAAGLARTYASELR